ncbi:MAG: MerR family transcriptional regulator [Terrimonas sp.]|nr:MerR family transcriptional regulator [Terrimonas sp.]
MSGFTIKDIENLSGIKAHTIRIWEQRYGFLKPQRTDTNIRYYSSDELKTVLNISLLNKYGYKISHINKMMPTEIREKILMLNSTEAQQERVINDLIQCMIDMDMDAFENVLGKYINLKGIEKSIIHIIFPFMERIGILWQTGHINPAQEHLVTNFIRQKLIVGIENTRSLVRIEKTFLLFLPEGEHHELGLLFIYYLLKSRGAQTIYLGANLPYKDLEYVVKYKQPDVVYLHLTSPSRNFNFEKFLKNLHDHLGEYNFVISGMLTQQYKKAIPENVFFKYSLSEVMEYLSRL